MVEAVTPRVNERVLELLESRQLTLATAESLTGGLVGELLTRVPGASAAYVGGVISYATRLKATLAGVEEKTLEQSGPVAAATAVQMARGVALRCGADWGLATTGVAGPTPQDGHPVGQVFVAVARPGEGQSKVKELRLHGTREEIRAQAAAEAVQLLADVLGMSTAAPHVEE